MVGVLEAAALLAIEATEFDDAELTRDELDDEISEAELCDAGMDDEILE